MVRATTAINSLQPFPSAPACSHRIQIVSTLHMETTPYSNSQPEQPTLAEISQPLIDLLNHSYPSWLGDYEVEPFGRLGFEVEPENEVSIEIYFDPNMPELNKKAFWTLTRKSGCERMWMSADDNTAKMIEDPNTAPPRFKLDRSCFHIGWYNQCTGYLVIDYRGDLDVSAAERQVALLVGYLEDVLNLEEVPPEVRWFFEAIPDRIISAAEAECAMDHGNYVIEENSGTTSTTNDAENPLAEED